MNNLTVLTDNVYRKYDLIHTAFPLDESIHLETLFPVNAAKRFNSIKYIEDCFSHDSSPYGHRPLGLSDWDKHAIMEVITRKIKQVVANRYSAMSRPMVVEIRLDMTLRNLYLLVRTLYGTPACIDSVAASTPR